MPAHDATRTPDSRGIVPRPGRARGIVAAGRRGARFTNRAVLRPTLRALLACALAFAGAPSRAVAADGSDSAAAAVRPGIRWLPDAPLLVAGLSLAAVGKGMDVTPRHVPPAGLDRGDVHWSFDRSSIGKRDTRALSASDDARDAAVAYPVAVAFFSQPSGTRFTGTLARAVLYQEAMLLAGGTVLLIKGSADRPRPYTYLPLGGRPGDPAYDVTSREAFRSMPSGHASTAFCGAAFAMTDHLLSRPDAGWLERTAVPFAGGVMAGMTAALRVEAGVHFPSDVIAGGLIGASSGVAVPLAHRYLLAGGRRAPGPSGHDWALAVTGLLAGVGTGVLVAAACY